MAMKTIGCGVLFVVCCAQPVLQSQMSPSHAYSVYPYGDSSDPNDVEARLAIQKSLKLLNEDRQKQITQDSAKLLRLATDLKAQMSEGSQAESPESAIQKAEQIAKLAHGIREKMILTFTR